MRSTERSGRPGRRSESTSSPSRPTPTSPRLYADATAFVFPSLYEGFGFPPLEAMARGCPVLASDIPSLREIAGDGALLLALDEQVWAQAIRRVVSDPGLRDELRERGRRNVDRYSWQQTAREVCALLESVGSARP